MATLNPGAEQAENEGKNAIAPHHFRNLLLVSSAAALLFSFVCINELNKGIKDVQAKCTYIQQHLPRR